MDSRFVLAPPTDFDRRVRKVSVKFRHHEIMKYVMKYMQLLVVALIIYEFYTELIDILIN